MSASRVETVERPRREAPADQQLKTSRLFKKVSNIRSTRRQSTDGKQQLGVPEVLRRTTRSMDLGPKDVAVLTSQHTALHMDRNSDTPSPSGESSENGPESHVDGSTMQQVRSPPPASIADAVCPRAVSNGMPASPQVPEGNGVTSESRATSLTQTVSQPEDVFHPSASTSRSNASTMGAPVTSPNTTPHSSPAVGTDGSSGPHVPLTSGQISPGLSDRRDLAPRLATLPPPMMASYMAKGSARLTPSTVSRQPPMPVFNLPPLPPVTPSQQFERPRQAPLRSIPALPMRGPSEAAQEDADHDNAMLDEEDEEDMDAEEDADASPGAGADAEGVASDEEMEDGTETESAATPRSRGDRIGALPEIEASRLQAEVTESLRGTVYFTPKPDGPSTPRLRPGSSSSAASDYFSSKRPDRLSDGRDSPVRTPRPADFFGSPAIRTPALGHAAYIAGMPPGSPGRPGLYQLGSRSMVDLLSMSKKGKDTATSPSIAANEAAERRKSKPLPNSPPTQEGEEGEEGTPKPSSEPQDILPSTPTLRRQRSMPIYRMSSDPPPYPDFHPRRPGPVIQPRDEEGEECLPLYSNAIYLAAVMPRKVEFTAPGVQAKDRKWRRVLCVLEGTAFRVYKCPPSVAGVSAIESWWEKKGECCEGTFGQREGGQG
ncbi:hypothetical protein DAEQUDRAFT_77811 [Daedalea quercina L-15889]|uniref:PH domain-containing protein n=1 Tax=Daedalea quercina L-15889 TaxID=1314783 RepID=A0A165SFN0_9APHY|nr:hypothetical protein DAEQUDRAFT_77811 [Daedalea quercina L-15889]